MNHNEHLDEYVLTTEYEADLKRFEAYAIEVSNLLLAAQRKALKSNPGGK